MDNTFSSDGLRQENRYYLMNPYDIELTPLRVVSVYLFLGLGFLYMSDVLAVQYLQQPFLSQVQTAKGIVEVLLTAGFIFYMTRHSRRQVQQVTSDIQLQSNLITVLSRVLRHNLRNDITVVRGRARQIADHTEGTPDGYDSILDTVDGLIDLSKKARDLEKVVTSNLEPEPVELVSLLDDITAKTRADYPSASFSIEAPDEVTIEAMPSLRLALEEVLENAAKHSGEAPTVAISVARTSSEAWTGQNSVEIEITDDGPGLPNEERKVIEKGVEEPLIHGSGLGLYTVYWIVTSHGGTIDILTSEQGTKLIISLPDSLMADSTAQSSDQQQLQLEQDRFKAIFTESFDGMVIFDDDQRIIEANEMAERLFDADQNELLGEDFESLATEIFDMEGEFREAIDHGGGRGRFEPNHSDSFSQTLEYAVTPDIIPGQHLMILRDVTEQIDREQMLATRERVLREMHEIISDRDRSFEDQVSSLLEIGRTELDTEYGALSKISGDDYLFEIVATDDDSVEAGDVVPVSATNCEFVAGEKETVVLGDIARDAPEETDRAGFTDWGISCYIGAPVLVDGEVYGTFCFYDQDPRPGRFSDWEVTLVDLMSRCVGYMIQAREHAEQLNRRETKLDRFTSVVSHDLRGPLTVAESRLKLAQETCESKHLSEAETALARSQELLADLRRLAHGGKAVDIEAVSIAPIAELGWQNTGMNAANLTVETDRTIRADRSRLQQLFENLFRNAVDHGGEKVTVRVGALDDGFYVADDGPGLPAVDPDRLVEMGFSTTEEGTGYGLNIVQEIAKAHDWTLSITEGETGGARFEFTGIVEVE